MMPLRFRKPCWTSWFGNDVHMRMDTYGFVVEMVEQDEKFALSDPLIKELGTWTRVPPLFQNSWLQHIDTVIDQDSVAISRCDPFCQRKLLVSNILERLRDQIAAHTGLYGSSLTNVLFPPHASPTSIVSPSLYDLWILGNMIWLCIPGYLILLDLASPNKGGLWIEIDQPPGKSSSLKIHPVRLMS